LWESLKLEIVSVIEATNRLRESPEFELLGLTVKEPALFDRVVAKQKAQLETEIARLRSEAEQLEKEIAGLTGREGAGGEQGPPGEVSTQQLDDAIAGTASDPSGIAPYAGSFSEPPTQAEMQDFAAFVETLRAALKR